MSLADAKFSALRAQGFLGTSPDMERAWLIDAGAIGGSIPDLWYNYLTGEGYSGPVQDMQYMWLGDLGYTGSAPDRWLQFWEAGGSLGGTDTLEVVCASIGSIYGFASFLPGSSYTSGLINGHQPIELYSVVASGAYILKLTGFASDPGQAFFDTLENASGTPILAADAVYSYAGGNAQWAWASQPLMPTSGSYTADAVW